MMLLENILPVALIGFEHRVIVPDITCLGTLARCEDNDNNPPSLQSMGTEHEIWQERCCAKIPSNARGHCSHLVQSSEMP